MQQARKVVISVDHDGEYVVDWALDNFIRPEDEVWVVHVFHTERLEKWAGSPAVQDEIKSLNKKSEDSSKAFGAQMARICASRKVNAHLVIESGDPREVIAQHSRTAQVLIVGNRDHDAIRRAVVGSVSDHLIHCCPCNIIIVRHPEVLRKASV